MAVATRKDLFGCPGESRWLARRIKLRMYASSSPLFYLRLHYGRQNANTTLSLAIADEIWQYHTGGNLTIFDKDYDTVEIAKVLAAKHTASLQLLCTVGGNQARLDARTEFEILELSPKGGVEAGHAHSCMRGICFSALNKLGYYNMAYVYAFVYAKHILAPVLSYPYYLYPLFLYSLINYLYYLPKYKVGCAMVSVYAAHI